MTITGIDSTGQSAGGNALPPDGVADADDLDAELLALETDVAAAPISVIPAADARGGAAPARAAVLAHSHLARHRSRLLSFIAVALFITAPLWLNLDHELRDDPQDQAFFEWMLAHGARVLTDGVYPFFSDRMNYPDGVNMMANTSVLAVSLPMTPITLMFGPHVAFNVFLTLALAVTGISWYLVLSRQFVALAARRLGRRAVLHVRAEHDLARRRPPEHRLAVPGAADHLALPGAADAGPGRPQRADPGRPAGLAGVHQPRDPLHDRGRPGHLLRGHGDLPPAEPPRRGRRVPARARRRRRPSRWRCWPTRCPCSSSARRATTGCREFVRNFGADLGSFTAYAQPLGRRQQRHRRAASRRTRPRRTRSSAGAW